MKRASFRASAKFVAAAALLLFAAGGCNHENKEALAPLPQPGGSAGAATPRVSGPVTDGHRTAAPSATAPGSAKPVMSAPAASAGSGDISLNFVDADVREITRTILGQMLKVTYAIDPNVHGTGTIQTAQPISRERALTLLEGLLAQNGASIKLADGVYQVTSNQAAALTANLVGASDVGAGTKVVNLRYASAADLANVLAPFLPPGAKVTPDPARNMLLITGDAATRSTIEQVISAFDIDLLADKTFALFPVDSDQPEKVAAELNKVLLSGENGALASVVQVIPMDRINAILVVSSQPRYLNDVRRLFALVDKVSSATVRSWHIYYVRNRQSTALEFVLQHAFTPDHVTATGQSDTNRLGSMVPGLQIGSANAAAGAAGSSPGNGAGGPSASPGGMTLAQNPAQSNAQAGPSNNGQAHAPPAQPPATEPLSAEDESGKEKDRIRIIADRYNNALLIYATPQEYSMIEGMLEKIDILPLQVQIDAVIAEVTLNDQLQYGVQFFFQNGGLSGILSQNSNSATGLPFSLNFPGFVLQKMSGQVHYALSALQAVTNVRVLSSPQITVLDNEMATLQVGDQVPYLTQQASFLEGTSSAGTPIVNSVAYQETGVILQVIPRVNSGGLVTLDIAQEVSEPVNTTTSTINSPTFSDRVVKSRVVVQDGQTIGLAGLISDNVSRTNGGVPLIKDIPVLGTVFSNQDNQRTRTELLVLLTPHVNYDQRAVRALTDDLRSKLWHAGLVPQQLRALPASGSANPNGFLFPPLK